jgi:HK97 family phage portal protein
MWIQRTFTEAELVVQRKKPDGMWERVDHDMQSLIANPNSAYDGDALWKATVLSYVMAGNAYWWKVRNDLGDVIALWYLPHWAIRPYSPFIDARGAITNYIVSITGAPVELAPRDVVHFRFGIDPEDPRLGLSPLASVMTEVETDMEAAAFSEDVVRNHGVPGMLISPKDSASRPTEKQVQELKEYLETAFTGRNRGRNMVMGVPTEVAQFGFDPNKLMLASLRDISEERVCAILGVPAAVVGFGAGLQSTKVGATMRELVKLAWVTCLIPMQKTMARTVTTQLLHEDFVGQARRFRARFDMSEASSFQEEFDLRVTSTMKLVDSNVLRIDRAQQILGLEVDPSRAVYLNEIPGATKAPAPVIDPTAADTQSATSADSEPPADVQKASPTPDDTRALIAAIADRWLPVIRTHSSNGNGRHHHATN